MRKKEKKLVYWYCIDLYLLFVLFSYDRHFESLRLNDIVKYVYIWQNLKKETAISMRNTELLEALKWFTNHY